MSYRVGLTAEAEAEIDRAFRWIDRDSPEAARRWYARMLEALRRLEANPYTGGPAPEGRAFREEIRHVLFRLDRRRAYRVVYTIDDEDVRVLGVRGPGQPPLEPDQKTS